ncbi:MAG: LysM peptidoglycan-binding domain-containing protein [Treponema sp.]|jgi:hypothetical protein|nr:LysM peptidoglycan-binding domain-containing protein [Treponema sp.]
MKRFFICLAIALPAFALTGCPGAPAPQQPITAYAPLLDLTGDPAPQPMAAVIAAHAPLLDLTGAQTHVVAPGETLVTVAQRFFGGVPNVGNAGVNNGFYFPIIILASGVTLADPDLIQPGMVLTVPDLRRNLDNPAARQAIRQSMLEIAEIYRVENRRPAKVQSLIALANSL